MSSPPDFAKRLAAKSDEGVYEMLANEGDYTPEAIKAARAELQRRELPAGRAMDQWRQAQDVKQAKRAKEEYKAVEPLGWFGRLLMLTTGPFMIVVVLLRYWGEGRKRKVRDALWWLLYSFIFWFIIFFVIELLKEA